MIQGRGEWHDPGESFSSESTQLTLKSSVSATARCDVDMALTNRMDGRCLVCPLIQIDSNILYSSLLPPPHQNQKRSVFPPIRDWSIDRSNVRLRFPPFFPMGNGDDGSARIGIMAFRLRQLHTAQPNPFFMNFYVWVSFLVWIMIAHPFCFMLSFPIVFFLFFSHYKNIILCIDVRLSFCATFNHQIHVYKLSSHTFYSCQKSVCSACLSHFR